ARAISTERTCVVLGRCGGRGGAGGGPGWDGSLNEPMNGEKGMLSEGGIRVPFLAAWPGVIPAGQVYNDPVISLDVAATAVALSGLKDEPLFDGVNLIPYLVGEKQNPPHEVLYWRWSSQSAIRVGDWKFLRGGSREYLYDIVNDPHESMDLLSSHTEKADELRSRLLAWTQELDPPGFIGEVMPETWENYFDHYLDGKPILPKQSANLEQPKQIEGWIARNAKLEQSKGFLKLTDADGEARLTPFVAKSKLSIEGPFEVSLAVRKPLKGKVLVTWREEGQKDFGSEKVVLDSNSGMLSGVVPSTGKVIHLRILFPNGDAEIGEILLSDLNSAVLQQWKF
ncbi:MAG: sulfatase/phosphatase domain-containing protein, partial [Verrucomicrobiota bacterium]